MPLSFSAALQDALIDSWNYVDSYIFLVTSLLLTHINKK